MNLPSCPRSALAALILGLAMAPVAAQEVRTGGPPPEIRALLDGFVEVVNGARPESWEAFAQARFSSALLQESADQRSALYRQIVDGFGTIALGGVMRRGADAPLELNVKGSKGSGVIVLGLAAGSPPRIASLEYTRRSGDASLKSNAGMHGLTGSAAGGGYSTALDLLTYVKAVRAGRFPGAEADMGIAGGAPGTNAIVEARGEWVVIVLTNFDPPVGEEIGLALADALTR